MAKKSKSAAGKTPFHAVVEKVQSGTISDKEFSNYFVAQPNPRQPFDFAIGINSAAVDLQGVEKSGKLADALVHDASIGRDQQIRAATPPKGFQRKTPIVAEGDSWFRLPQVIMPPTLIDVLQQTDGYPIDNMAHWGDTLAEMIQTGQFWPPLISEQADTFLFSGGGNDVLGGEGGIARFLNLFDVGHTKPSDAAYYIKPEFYDNLKLIVQNYESLIQRVHVRAPNVIMIGHGYDHAIPRSSGPWIGNGMLFVGLDPTFQAALCQAIVRIMIDAFNNALAAFAMTYSNYRYVDLRGAIGKNQWRDELHPTVAGAAKTAERFDAALRKLPKSDAFTAPLIASRALFGRAA
ncbi:MAG TPA: SGNH/GDSL hydrolase family protein [Bradyrhizobium sp.]|jgi:lysophospholipase L1-like esterase|nr:SGNH/GDSL hydrolase family protein [Bradyrhizobium sp.]